MNIKKGSKVRILIGKDKNKEGEVIEINRSDFRAKVKGLNINEFFSKYVGEKIDYLSIDLEGIDYEVMMEIDLLRFQIENISIEHLHLNKSQKKNMVNYLNKNGYSYFGNGYDHKNFDYLFKKEKIIWNRFLSKFLWLVSHKKVKYFNKFFLKGSE